jgi:hypothetical protein
VIFALVFVSIIGIQESVAEQIPSPRQQLEDGVTPEEIQCKENRVLVLRSNGFPACVTERTAERTGWEIIKTEKISAIGNSFNEHIPSVSNESSLDQILENYGIELIQHDNVDFSKTIVTDADFKDIRIMAGIPAAYFASIEFPEFVKVGDEFDVTVKWTFTEYDEEGNIEHQYVPVNSLTKEIFNETLLLIKIPENIEMITDVSDWEETVKVYHDQSYNFDSSFTTYTKTAPFDYTDAMHEQTYRFKLAEPFFPPFDHMTFGGLGFGKQIHHQDGSLLHELDLVSIKTLQSSILVERLGTTDPQYPDVPRSEVNWGRASEIVPKAINTPTDPDESQTQEIRDFYVNVLKRNPTNDELLNSGVSQAWIDSFFEKFPELVVFPLSEELALEKALTLTNDLYSSGDCGLETYQSQYIEKKIIDGVPFYEINLGYCHGEFFQGGLLACNVHVSINAMNQTDSSFEVICYDG